MGECMLGGYMSGWIDVEVGGEWVDVASDG